MENNQKIYKFPRVCSISGEGMWEGYCFGDGEEYFKNESDLLEHLHRMEIHMPCNLYTTEDPNQSWSDKQFLNYCYEEGIYYYTEWEDLDEDGWYESEHEDGKDAVWVDAE